MSESRADVIRRLRSQGMTLRSIGEHLGVTKSTVNRALYPAVREYEAAYNRARYYTVDCRVCGSPCTFNRHDPGARGLYCAACYHARATRISKDKESS